MVNKEIEIDIIKEVNELDLKFPVSSIAKWTGYNKSNVSEILSGKKNITPKFKKKLFEFIKNEKNLKNEKDLVKEKIATGIITKEDLDLIYKQGVILADALKKQVENNNEILQLLKEHFKQSS